MVDLREDEKKRVQDRANGACFGFLFFCGACVMLGFGGQNLTRAKADARGHNVASYKIAISHWTQDATGAPSFFNAFSSASGMALNVSLATPNVLLPNMAPFSVPMTFGTQQVAIGDTGGDAAISYSPQYYLVGQPLFSQYPSTFTPQTTVAFTLVGTNATALPTVTVPAVRCRNYQRSEDCGKKCTRYYYYRVISVLVSVTLQVTLPAACATGPCAAASLVTDGCSGTYTEQPSMLITESDYRADGGNCRNLPSNSLISQPGVQPLLSVRSSADPRVAAAQLTGCSYQFGPTAKELHKTGAGLIAGASVIMCLGCGCCFVAFDKGSDQPAAAPADGAVAEVVVHTEPAQQPYDESGQPQQPQAVYVVYEQPQQPVYVVPPLAPLPPPLAPLPPLSPAAGPAGGRGRGRGRAPVAAHGGGRGRGATHVQAAPPPVAYDKSQY